MKESTVLLHWFEESGQTLSSAERTEFFELVTKKMLLGRMKGERRSKPLRILLNPAERDVLDGFAKSKSMDVSTWARSVLLEAAGFARK